MPKLVADAAVLPANVVVGNALAGAGDNIPARLDRLPLSPFHVRVLGVIGLAHLFDAFDSLAIAFVLPSLIAVWRISIMQVGVLLSIGFAGQMLGAIVMSAVAERMGRRFALRAALFIVSLLSLACVFAPSFGVLVGLRFLQGIGIGGEVPVAASYLNELCPARFRGRMIYLLQAMFGMGTLVTAAVSVLFIPRFGWQVMFVIGGLPIVLALFLNRLVPESPRWLVSAGRTDEADVIVANFETQVAARGAQLPPIAAPGLPTGTEKGTGLRQLFERGYARRTLSAWAMAFCLSIIGYGILNWMPTLYTSIYKLPLAKALTYSLAPPALSIAGCLSGALLIDWLGRRRCFLLGFVGGGLPIGFLAITSPSAFVVMLMSTLAMFFMALLLCGIYVYTPEIYPTRMRALGTGVTTAWMRIASIVGPLLVGTLITRGGVQAVFGMFATAALVGAVVVFWFVIETRGRSLEEIAQ